MTIDYKKELAAHAKQLEEDIKRDIQRLITMAENFETSALDLERMQALSRIIQVQLDNLRLNKKLLHSINDEE